MDFREVEFNEIDDIWKIDRTEYIDAVYIKSGRELKEKIIDKTYVGWPPDEHKIYGPILRETFDRKGFFYGGFIDGHLKAIVILDSKWIGIKKDTLQLKFLHIDREYRHKGFGKILFYKAVEKARELKASRIYISSCEAKNTVEFYKHLGCKITDDLDEKLYALEPNDIHMDFIL